MINLALPGDAASSRGIAHGSLGSLNEHGKRAALPGEAESRVKSPTSGTRSGGRMEEMRLVEGFTEGFNIAKRDFIKEIEEEDF
jgi:hypothetical protein